MKRTYLVIKSDALIYADTATEAVEHIIPPWNSSDAIRKLNALQPGDELDLDNNSSIIVLTGRNVS